MKLSEEMAVRLHRMMWSDMQRELGDNPSCGDRLKFKFDWIRKHFPGESIANDCWLCEYASSVVGRGGNLYCVHCPIKWPNRHCNTTGFTYEKEPISEILALPARNVANDYEYVAYSYYKSREVLLSKASGRPASTAIDDHVKAIQEKAVAEYREEQAANDAKAGKDYAYTRVMKNLSEASGLSSSSCVENHVKKIQEKAVEEYFAKTPGAKLATLDVDNAFKQYADEQKAPIFKQLSKASGLSEHNHAVLDHIILVKNKAKQEGRDETKQQMKDLLAEQSGLNHNRPIDDHIREIVKNSMEAGAAEERDRIQEKIYEVLLS